MLPARFPNLLVNGSQGIAVGMATNIPPHNLGEVIDATVHLIDHPDATPDDLMQFVKGPDFPTGGSILGRAGIMDAYRTGRGSVKMRATASIEETRKGGYQIVVTELPYQTSCSSIAGRIQELVDSGELDGISDVNDGSAGGKTELVVSAQARRERQRGAQQPVQAHPAADQLRREHGGPRRRRAAHAQPRHRAAGLHPPPGGGHHPAHRVPACSRAKDRAHKVEGRLKALNVIDQIIALIRASEDAGSAKEQLMAAPYEFSEIQAVDILDMQLRQLTRLSRIDLEREMQELQERITELQSILDSDEKLRGVIKSEMLAIKDEFATPRVCQVAFDTGEMSIEDLVEDKELVIVMTQAQYVKAVPAGNFKTQGRGGRGVSGAKLKTDDIVRNVIFTHGARVPAVLQQPGQGLPLASDGHPRA